MHLSSRTDVSASQEFVYKHLTDFEYWERAALRRGAEVTRLDTLAAPGVGMGWRMKFTFRGKERKLTVKLREAEPINKLTYGAKGKLVDATIGLEIFALSPKRTRLVIHLEVQPLTLAARLFLQSLKLAKGRVQKRLNDRMGQLAKDIEAAEKGKPAPKAQAKV